MVLKVAGSSPVIRPISRQKIQNPFLVGYDLMSYAGEVMCVMVKIPIIYYTLTDEAPALATRSLLPIVQAFAKSAGVTVDIRDISLAGRILSQFPECLTEDQRVGDHLAELGALTLQPEANIIKLPNISASMPQLKAAIAELQSKGFEIPDYPDDPCSADEAEIKLRYDKVKGSAVNPVLREGNSDRRAPRAVKEYARTFPHRMGAWSAESKTRVVTMGKDDFFSNEKSHVAAAETQIRIEFVHTSGEVETLKSEIRLLQGEILDATFMRKEALVAFLGEQMRVAKEEGTLFSLHLKATMMKVSDPILFGHAVKVFFQDLVSQHGDALAAAGVDFNHGLGDLTTKIDTLPDALRSAVLSSMDAAYAAGPDLAMVDSNKGITNLHVPSDVIIDASMPAMIREGGKMWNKDGETQDTLAVIPDSSYAGVYQAVISFCQQHGALDPRTIGSVPNVGLMAQKAEEYGSHDKTFEAQANGTIRIVDQNGAVLISHEVKAGDVWRACQTKDAAVRDWVKLAVTRSRDSQTPAIFWLNGKRAHDAVLIGKVKTYLADHNTEGLDLRILPPAEACKVSLERMVEGQDTISVTGNVLRDYLTDLFPILEVGTSAKMLSIVPLMRGGGLFETGAGGSAPKHVQQFVDENYLRWDSLGEFLALAVSFEHLAKTFDIPRAALLGKTLDAATGKLLQNNKSPARKLGGLDNRGSHFYLALYWAQALATQTEDCEMQQTFSMLAHSLANAEEKIVAELTAVQGRPVDIGGYYFPDDVKASAAMRPSRTLNALIKG